MNYGPPSNYNYNYNYPPGPPGPPGPPQNYYPQEYYNNHNNNGNRFPHTPSPPAIHPHPHHHPHQQPHHQPSPTPPITLTITTAPHDTSLTLLTTDTSPNTQPHYTAALSKTHKPHIKLSRGPSNPHEPSTTLGTAVMHTFSSTTECTLPLTPPCEFPVKESSLSGSFTLTHPALGSWKWKANQLTGTSLELVDEAGTKVAKIKVTSGLSGLSGSKKKGKRLETYVPLQQGVLDVVVLSALVAMVGTRGMIEAGAEVFGALAGA